MKKILLALAFVATNGFALEVTSSGCGDTYDEAVKSAKFYAVERVNGAWLHATSSVRDSMFSEKITQYSGGVIKDYSVISNQGTCVIIKADVVPRSNKVESNSTDVKRGTVIHLDSKVDNNESKAKAVKVLDSKESAIAFKSSQTEFIPLNRNEIALKVSGVLSFQDKWKADYVELQKMSGWFDLPSFREDPKFVLVGYDHNREVYQTSFLYDGELDMYEVTPKGVFVKPNTKEDVVLKFRVPMNVIRTIDRFEVKVL